MFETNVLGPRFMRRRAHANLIQGGASSRAWCVFNDFWFAPFPPHWFFFLAFYFWRKNKKKCA